MTKQCIAARIRTAVQPPINIETVFVENFNLPPQGGGEPAIIGMGGVVATAIHDATGAAIFQLPMTPTRVKAAIEKA